MEKDRVQPAEKTEKQFTTHTGDIVLVTSRAGEKLYKVKQYSKRKIILRPAQPTDFKPKKT